jgi:proteasome accessory factor B
VSSRRAERLVNLVLCLLSTRQFLTAERIRTAVPGYEPDDGTARADEAFKRMFERDKAELRELGVPLETGTASVFDQEPGYRIAHREYALPDIILEPDEAAAVGIAARLWQHAGLAAAASSGLAKLRAAGVEVDPQATLGVEPVVTVDPAFGPLTSAARDRRAVTFSYRVPEVDDPATRRLEPWGVVCWRGRWYVVGHDRDRDATRCFRLSRIVGNVRPVGRSSAFVPPPNVDLISYVAGFDGPVQRTGRAVVVARPGRAAGLRRWASAVDGDRLTLPYADVERLASTLAGYGPDVFVEGPPEVRDAVIQQLKEVMSRHEGVVAA